MVLLKTKLSNEGALYRVINLLRFIASIQCMQIIEEQNECRGFQNA